MISIHYGSGFLKSARKLPRAGQVKLARLAKLIVDNPYHSKLHTKHLSGELTGLYSFRITRDWRVIFKFLSPIDVMLIEVAHRKDIYR